MQTATICRSGKKLIQNSTKILSSQSGPYQFPQHFGSTHFLVFNTGVVLWVPPAKFRAFCKVRGGVTEVMVEEGHFAGGPTPVAPRQPNLQTQVWLLDFPWRPDRWVCPRWSYLHFSPNFTQRGALVDWELFEVQQQGRDPVL